MLSMCSSAPSWRQRPRTRTLARSPSRIPGSCRSPTPSNGCGPTTTPTSSARSFASCGNSECLHSRPPYQLDALGEHVAEGEQHRGPDESRGEVCDLEAPDRHME